MKINELSSLSLDDIRKLNAYYEHIGIPSLPSGYDFDGFLCPARAGDLVLRPRGGYIVLSGNVSDDYIVIGLKKKKKLRRSLATNKVSLSECRK